VITPAAVKYAFRGIFDEGKQIDLWAYNIETIMAEKIETILRRGVFSMRPRDFYDIYILSTTQEFDRDLLLKALLATAEHRKTAEQIADQQGILRTLWNSQDLRNMWQKYCRQYSYAEDISYEQVMRSLEAILLK
jgi:predicted nucleotidyltransferase component of viral defense system